MRSAGSGRPTQVGKKLQSFFTKLLREFGPQGWWPGRTRLEVILGAVLTQNTAWRNAALALKTLRQRGLLSLKRLNRASAADLEIHVRQAGFYRQKAKAIRNLLDWLKAAHGGSLASMFGTPPEKLRRDLLGLKGLGPETADAILLYAGRRPFFVADAYTRRILARHAIVPTSAGYDEVQRLLHQHLPADTALFNEFHALLVEVGKRNCRKEAPRCDACPLEPFLPGTRNIRSGKQQLSGQVRPAALLRDRKSTAHVNREEVPGPLSDGEGSAAGPNWTSP